MAVDDGPRGMVALDPRYSSPREVMEFTRAMRNVPELWAIFQRVGTEKWFTDEETKQVNSFTYRYIEEVKKINPASQGPAVQALRKLAAGWFDSLDSNDAWNALRSEFCVRREE